MKYRILAVVLAAELALLGALVIGADAKVSAQAAETDHKRALARRFDLTDLALWTEARYTRHPAMADRFSAFQDFPSSIEHFPAGAIIGPPSELLLAPPPARVDSRP